MKRLKYTASTLALLASVAMAGSAYSADEVVVNAERGEMAIGALKDVKPLVNPLKPPNTAAAKAEAARSQYAPGVKLPKTTKATAPRGRAFGDFGIPYTSTRVGLGSSGKERTGPNWLSTTSPYRRVGKLFLSAGYCSASLIRRSVIVTAAHCIQGFGSGANIYSNFQFTPGYYNASGATSEQIAPYGTWSWALLLRPGSWADGTDIGSGSARANDLAVIVLNKNSQGRFLGDITGWLAYGWNSYSFTASPKTGNLAVAETATLGYPFLMDGGNIMQRTDGPSYTTTVGGAGQIWQGNNFTGGSSGGPWIVNFRTADAALAGGAVIGSAPVMAVVGVTSWGTSDPNAPKDNYSSRFEQNARYPNGAYGSYGAGNIGSLLNTLCSAKATATQTYAQLGYCD